MFIVNVLHLDSIALASSKSEHSVCHLTNTNLHIFSAQWPAGLQDCVHHNPFQICLRFWYCYISYSSKFANLPSSIALLHPLAGDVLVSRHTILDALSLIHIALLILSSVLGTVRVVTVYCSCWHGELMKCSYIAQVVDSRFVESFSAPFCYSSWKLVVWLRVFVIAVCMLATVHVVSLTGFLPLHPEKVLTEAESEI